MSELLIKALEPYLTVYTVGATTAGYMGITESYINSSYPYTFNLVTSKAYNASGDTYTNSGITASTTASDTSDLSTLLSFGNESETLLAAALALIKK
jgi:C-terminal processing protease CtpA/Prc